MRRRKRNPENEGLPKRWKVEHGAVFYQVPRGQESAWDGKKKFRLGGNLHEAYVTWADRLKPEIEVRRIEHLLDRYLLEVTPTKAKRTQVDEPRYVAQLKNPFGHMRLQDLEPQHIYQYFDRRKDQTKDKDGNIAVDRKANNQARQEIKLLSHAFTKAVEWGYIKKHPFKREVRFDRDRAQKPRDRYVEDWEIVEALSLKPFRKRGSVLMVQGYIRLKLLTGLRMTDLLNLQASDLKDDGIHVKASKTQHSSGVKQIFAWLDQDGQDTGRREAIDMCLATRPLDVAHYVFCTDEGASYIDEDGRTTSFNSVWKRFMDRVLKETKVAQRFAERDLRAKAATDKEEAEGLERARKLLGHVDARITKKWYLRKPEIVR
jgi:integrase